MTDYPKNDFRYYTEDYLEHFGIKGMKWGKRKKQARLIDPLTALRIRNEKQHQPEENRRSVIDPLTTLQMRRSLKNKSSSKNESDKKNKKRVQNATRFKTIKVSSDKKSTKRNKISKKVDDVINKLSKNKKQIRGSVKTSPPKGKIKRGYTYTNPEDMSRFGRWYMKKTKKLRARQNGVGHSDNLEDFLAHYGVKGMEWGKRKKRPQSHELRTIIRGRNGSRIIRSNRNAIRTGTIRRTPASSQFKADPLTRLRRFNEAKAKKANTASGTNIIRRSSTVSNPINTAIKRPSGINLPSESEDELENVALQVIRGEYGVGAARKEALEKAGIIMRKYSNLLMNL